jgi:hypothetical protein
MESVAFERWGFIFYHEKCGSLLSLPLPLPLFSIFLLFLQFPGWENRRENVRILSGTTVQASKRRETVRLI